MSGSPTPSNPLITQGTLNRLRGSVVVPSFPTLNVTAPYLGPEGISLAQEGKSLLYLPTMTGAVTSTEPYMMVSIRINLLRTQNLATQWRTQQETLSTIGNLTITPDTAALPLYLIVNGGIESVAELRFNGQDAGWLVTCAGYYLVNNQAWSLT